MLPKGSRVSQACIGKTWMITLKIVSQELVRKLDFLRVLIDTLRTFLKGRFLNENNGHVKEGLGD